MKNKPLNIFISYIIITMLISFFGPMEYFDYSKVSVAIYMTFFLIVFTLGYKFSFKFKIRDYQSSYENITNIIKYCILFSIFSVGVEFFSLLIQGKISLQLGTISKNYFNAYSNYTRNSGQSYNLSQILFFISGVPKLITVVLGTYYFKSLSKKYKTLYFIYFVLTIITYGLGHGKQKQIGEMVIFILVALFFKMVELPPNKQKKVKIRIFFMLSVFVSALSIIQYLRYESLGTTLFNFNSRTYSQSYYDINHWFFGIFGTKFGFGLASLISGYFSMGYYGLSLNLKLPFVYTYGVGNSYSLMVFFNRFIGTDFLLDKTYIMRMEAETGWPGLSRWHTIFPWLASDFTFIGAVLIFFPIAFIFARCWKEIIFKKNPTSMLMFAWLVEGLLFVPANNQLLHGIDSLFTTILITILWLLRYKLGIFKKR